MVAPTLYRSDDGSAPTLNRNASSLIGLLDAILVTGYGAKSAAGWTKPYTGTDKAVFQPAGGHQHLLRVDDTALQMARVVGYLTMTDVDTGVGVFPNAVQVSGGMYMRKSTSADGTTRSWLCAATDTFFYLIIGSASTTVAGFAGGDSHLAFGSFDSVIVGDRYNTLLAAATSSSTSDTTSATAVRHSITNFTSTGQYMPGSGGQVDIPCAATLRSTGINTHSSAGVSGTAVPNPAGGKVHLTRLAVMDFGSSTAPNYAIANSLRGWMPGIWVPDHIYSGFTTLDICSGASGSTLDGKEFLIVRTAGTNCVLFETNGGW